jgi:acyl dehydratase
MDDFVRRCDGAASDAAIRDDKDGAVRHRYFEDFAIGQRFETGAYTLRSDELFEFARRYDPQPFHLDSDAAALSVFGGIAASGWHTAALTIKLLVESDLAIAGGIVGRVVETLEWPRPVRADDTLMVRSEVLDASPSRSRPGGKVRLRSETLNQDGQVVQTMTALLLVPSR